MYFNPWRSKAYYNLRVTLGAFTNTNMKSHDKFAAFNADFISGMEMTIFCSAQFRKSNVFLRKDIESIIFHKVHF